MNPAIRHVYIHFPYCLHRCGYCDFATTVARVVPRERYLQHILTELEMRAASQQFAPLETVFFGGGTPSLWGPAAIAAVLDWLNRRAGFAENPEITLEANPGALESGDLAAYATAGITRVSVGIQALHDARLRALDRLHDAAAARQTLAQLGDLLATGRLRSANADLIFGVPGQTLLDLRTDVAGILDYGLSHLSAYSLTVESGTPLAAQVKRGLVARPDDDLQATMLDALPGMLAPYGLARYEVSNYARPGHPSRHNLAYWTGRYYLAVGVGAHGFLPEPGAVGLRYGNSRKHERWMAALANAPRCWRRWFRRASPCRDSRRTRATWKRCISPGWRAGRESRIPPQPVAGGHAVPPGPDRRHLVAALFGHWRCPGHREHARGRPRGGARGLLEGVEEGLPEGERGDGRGGGRGRGRRKGALARFSSCCRCCCCCCCC